MHGLSKLPLTCSLLIECTMPLKVYKEFSLTNWNHTYHSLEIECNKFSSKKKMCWDLSRKRLLVVWFPWVTISHKQPLNCILGGDLWEVPHFIMGSLLVLGIGAIPKWRNTKAWKDTEQYPHHNTIANQQQFLQHQDQNLYNAPCPNRLGTDKRSCDNLYSKYRAII